MTTFRRFDRNGATLIEMITIMSALTLLMVVNARWIHQSIEFASVTKQRQRYQQVIKRIAPKFRDDVRHSQHMSLTGETQLKLVDRMNRVTTYTIEEMKLRVEVKDTDKIIFRDHFDLGPNTFVQWDVSEMPQWISLVVSRKSPPATSVAKPANSSDEISGSSTPRNRLPPIDLHVRAGPNPWQYE